MHRRYHKPPLRGGTAAAVDVGEAEHDHRWQSGARCQQAFRQGAAEHAVLAHLVGQQPVRDVAALLRTADDHRDDVARRDVMDADDPLTVRLDLPGKSGEHQLRNQEVFYGKRKQADAGVSEGSG